MDNVIAMAILYVGSLFYTLLTFRINKGLQGRDAAFAMRYTYIMMWISSLVSLWLFIALWFQVDQLIR